MPAHMACMRPLLPSAAAAGLSLLLAAGPAAAENPLLVPSPLAPERVRSAPADPVASERARAYRDELLGAARQRELLDAQGRLDPAERRDLLELRGEAARVTRSLMAPPPPSSRPGGPSGGATAVERVLSGEDRPPGTLERLPRLGRGGATLKPGARPVQPTGLPDPAPEPEPLAPPGGRMEFGWGGPSRPAGD